VLFVDECHLLWGDVCGYVWGKTDSRIEIPIKNDKQRQTYYGAMNYRTGKVIIKQYRQGNTENTIQFVKYLIQQNQSSLTNNNWGWSHFSSQSRIPIILKSSKSGKLKRRMVNQMY
jgi:hypothetical protein